jgi:hypothetical protein
LWLERLEAPLASVDLRGDEPSAADASTQAHTHSVTSVSSAKRRFAAFLARHGVTT